MLLFFIIAKIGVSGSLVKIASEIHTPVHDSGIWESTRMKVQMNALHES